LQPGAYLGGLAPGLIFNVVNGYNVNTFENVGLHPLQISKNATDCSLQQVRLTIGTTGADIGCRVIEQYC